MLSKRRAVIKRRLMTHTWNRMVVYQIVLLKSKEMV